MPMITVLLAAGCTSGPPPSLNAPNLVTDVRWTHEGVETAFEDALIQLFGTSSSSDGSCEPVTRIYLYADNYEAYIDLASYASGTAVVTPSQPSENRYPTLIFKADAPPQVASKVWSGGPASFTVDTNGPEPTHTLTLDAPTACPTPWHDIDPSTCVEESAVTFSFTGALDQVISCEPQAAPGSEIAPSGLPYCLPDSDHGEWEWCGGTGTPSDVVNVR